MCTWFSNLSDDNKLKLIALIGAVIAFSVALYQYYIAQKWKKTEFLAKEYERFNNDKNVQRSFLILDWPIIDIFYPEGELLIARNITVTRKLLADALSVSEDLATTTTDKTFVRLTIDKFLFKMGLFQQHIDNDLIEKDDIKSYLIYWIDLIGDINSRLDSNVRKELYDFIRRYKYASVIKLFESFGYSLNVS